MNKIHKTKEQWKSQLSAEQFRVTRNKGTERAFTGEYTDCFVEGVYHCVCCGQVLFLSQAKFDAGCGWPSFSAPASDQAVALLPDHSAGMVRTEVICQRCDAHLGHVFDDGPQPSGQRFCINSLALKFRRLR